MHCFESGDFALLPLTELVCVRLSRWIGMLVLLGVEK